MKFMRQYLLSLLMIVGLASNSYAAADLGNSSVISPVDSSNGSGTCPSWLGSAAPSTLDDSGRCLQGAIAREWQNRSFAVTSSGTAPTFVVAYTVAPAAYRTGQVYSFIAHAAAVGSETANINTLGAKNLKKVVAGSKTALAANDFYAGDFLMFAYDGTDLVWVNAAANLTGYATIALTPQLASANTFTADQTIKSADAGAATAPLLYLHRDSATPAASDVIGSVQFAGEDSGSTFTRYAEVKATILDPTDTSEDGSLGLGVVVAGTFADQLNIANGVYTTTATGGAQGAGTINATEYYKNGVALATGITLGTEQASTSGTAINFTSIPAGVKRIKIMLADVSTNGAASLAVQIGDSGGLENTGYTSTAGLINEGGTADAAGADSTQFLLSHGGAAGDAHSGTITLDRMNATHKWVMTSIVIASGPNEDVYIGGGSKTLSAELDRVTVKAANGTDAFDAGAINISYE